jgi:HPt (histidine-containing phosphotransfer) domain-containing protein
MSEDVSQDAPIFDVAVVDALRDATGGDEEFLRDLVATYRSEGESNLEMMATAAARGDTAAIVPPAHTLKSTSASVGAMRLSAISRGIEEAGRARRADGLAGDVDRAKGAWVETIAALTAAGLLS